MIHDAFHIHVPHTLPTQASTRQFRGLCHNCKGYGHLVCRCRSHCHHTWPSKSTGVCLHRRARVQQLPPGRSPGEGLLEPARVQQLLRVWPHRQGVLWHGRVPQVQEAGPPCLGLPELSELLSRDASRGISTTFFIEYRLCCVAVRCPIGELHTAGTRTAEV